MKHRVIEIDLWRFIAAVAIMTHHLYTTGLDGMYYRLHDGNLFVEFFFLLTGYYMAKKIAKDAEFENKSFGEAFKVSIDYTFRKYKKLWGICALATCAQYSLLVLSDISLADKFKQVINFPMDILLLTELYQRPLVTPLWFLGAMFIALPFVATLMQIGNRLFQAFLSLVLIGTYYGFWLPVVIIPNNLVSTGGGEDILRSFICMYAGCFMYAVSEYIAKNEKIMFSKKWLSFAGQICMLAVFAAIWIGHVTMIHTVLAFLASIILMNSAGESQSRIAPISAYLGELSMPIFVWNWFVGTFIYQYFRSMEPIHIMIWYYIVTFVLANISLLIMRALKHRENDFIAVD